MPTDWEKTVSLWVLIVGLLMMAVTAAIAGRRIIYLYRLISSGQPAPDRIKGVTKRLNLALKSQLVEVFGQRKLLKWTIPGAAHAMVMWAFFILGTVYVEAFGILFSRNPEWAIPIVGHWDVIGFAQDTIAILCLVGLAIFARIRLRETPDKLGRKSRFSGSHTGGAWLVLFMIFNVIWTMFFFRGSAAAAGNLPYGWGAYASNAVGELFGGISHDTLELMESLGLLAHIAVALIFLVDVVHSKHLHVFIAPVNVLFGRKPQALGAVKPLTSGGKAVTLDDIDDLDEDARLGVGAVEDFTWKGLLDFATCTECGRCQSQCPAWNTEKPLSPKMLILMLRDHAFAKGPAILAGEDADRSKLPESAVAQLDRPLVGETEGYAWEPTGGGVIDPDVLWSCVTCGACVNQCPVDIEHVDHIVDMRRYQVLVESNFPAELNTLFRGLENKGNPWNLSASARLEWAKDLPFDVKVVGEDVESLDEVEWLFWVGCAGAYEDRAKKTTRAVAELLDIADVEFAVLGNGETCTGDSARRAGNEFVFQGLAQQNVETFKEYKVKKVVSSCPHCMNTLRNEYKEFGVELEVIHHTQLLNRLVREGKLTPMAAGAGTHERKITYHDPCYLGRHNQVYSPPRELIQILPGAEFAEMERSQERSFCCGAGGARMWMEETIGTRINDNRTAEAVGTGADQIAVGCPFCRVMLDDGLTAAQANGAAREEVEVLDVAQMLLASVKGQQATKLLPGQGAAAGAPAAEQSVATKARPEAGDVTVTANTIVDTDDAGAAPASPSTGSSLFGDPEAAVADAKESRTAPTEGSLFESDKGSALADGAGGERGGSSLFDGPAAAAGGAEAKQTEAKTAKTEAKTQPASSGGSLFDVGGDAEPKPAEAEPEPADGKVEPAEAKADPAEEPAAPATPAGGSDLGSGGSLFDIPASEPAPAAKVEPAAQPAADRSEPAPKPAEEAVVDAEVEGGVEAAPPRPASQIPSGGSLFDIEAPATPDAGPGSGEAPPPGPTPESDPVEADARDEESSTVAPAPKSEAAPASEIPSGGSLFDISAPEPPAPSTADVEAVKEDASATGSVVAPDPDIADDSAEGSPGTADVEEETAGEEPPPAEPAPQPSSGEAHEPRTDVDINKSGSLFDL